MNEKIASKTTLPIHGQSSYLNFSDKDRVCHSAIRLSQFYEQFTLAPFIILIIINANNNNNNNKQS